MITSLKKYWFRLAATYSNDNALCQTLWGEIESQYSTKKRYYHNLSHIYHMLNLAETVKTNIRAYDDLSFAIWYHDIVYNVSKSTNEEKSAEFAKNRLKLMKFDEKRSKIIQNMIISTKNHQILNSDNEDNAYLLDLDLSILGSDWDTYKLYAQNIRKEYGIYPDFMYKKGRKKVLRHFLERTSLYFTSVFHDQYERNARQNLSKELEML